MSAVLLTSGGPSTTRHTILGLLVYVPLIGTPASPSFLGLEKDASSYEIIPKAACDARDTSIYVS